MKIIDVFICKLRNRLKVVGAGSMIATVWGQGYTLRKIANGKLKPQSAVPANPVQRLTAKSDIEVQGDYG